jgi:hypothetical protein
MGANSMFRSRVFEPRLFGTRLFRFAFRNDIGFGAGGTKFRRIKKSREESQLLTLNSARYTKWRQEKEEEEDTIAILAYLEINSDPLSLIN